MIIGLRNQPTEFGLPPSHMKGAFGNEGVLLFSWRKAKTSESLPTKHTKQTKGFCRNDCEAHGDAFLNVVISASRGVNLLVFCIYGFDFAHHKFRVFRGPASFETLTSASGF